MKYLSRKNVLEHHNVGPDDSSNTDNRRVPICNLGAFSGTGVNKDPRPNIDRVYVSCLHIFSPTLDAFEDWRVEKKKNMVQKKNVNADQKKREKKICNVDRGDVGAAHEGFTSSTFQQSLTQKGFVSGLRLKNRATTALPLSRFATPSYFCLQNGRVECKTPRQF